MNSELIKIISDLKVLFDDWNSKKIPSQDEFINELTPLALKLFREVRKPQEAEIKEEEVNDGQMTIPDTKTPQN